MKSPQKETNDYIFTTNIVDSTCESEFMIKIFPYSADMECEGTPAKIIHNFDELIDFFEEEQREEDL